MSLNLNDQSGNSNTLTNNNTATASASVPFSAGGNTTSAALASASSQFFTAADSSSLHFTNALTAQGWFNFTTTPSSGNAMGLITKDDEASQRTWFWWLKNNAGTLRLEMAVFGNSTDNYYFFNWTPTTSTWYHLAVTVDLTQANGSKLTFYINGVSQGNGTQIDGGAVTTFNTGTSTMTIGSVQTASAVYASYLNGLTDDIRIYNIVRSASAIASDYQTDIGHQTGLVAYYPFEVPVLGTGFLALL